MTAALAAQVGAGERKPLHELCPKLAAAARQAIVKAEQDRSVLPELIWYAREQCVSLPEARRRMDIQLRDAVGPETEPGAPPAPPPNSIGNVQARLEQNEASTFAGLWIEHQPTYRIVVAFTRSGAATLAKYTRDPLFVAVDRGGPSLAELNAPRDRLYKDLQRLGARPSVSAIDVSRGRMKIGVVGDLTGFNAAVARGEVELPPFVDIQPPGPLKHVAPPLPADWQKTVRAFPHARYRNGGPVPDMLRTGTVVLEEGCLRIVGERRNPVIVWPSETALDLTTPGKVRVLNRMSGETIEAGKRINLGGNSGDLAKDQEITGADPACPGPYFAMGTFGPLDRVEEQELQGRTSRIQGQLKVGRDAALRLAKAEIAREERFQQLAASLLSNTPETYAGMYPYEGRATLKFAGDPKAELRKWVPRDLRNFAKAERVPRSLAALKTEKDAFLDDVERLGLKARADEDIEQGRIVISSEDLPALGRAALAGKVRIPATARVQSNGGMPEGEYGEANTQALNRALEAAPDWAEMRGLVDLTKLPGFLVTYKENESDRGPTRAQSLEITRFLIALGFTAEDLRALHAEGRFAARAYVEQNGRATVVNRALLAQEAVLAEVVDVTPELLGDGFRSTARLRIVEGLKGDLHSGEMVRVRLISGVGSDGKLHQANDEPVVVPGLPGAMTEGSRWFLLLSEGTLARRAALVGRQAQPPRGAERTFGILYGAWPIEGVEVRGTYAELSLGTLDKVRQQLAPVDAAFDRARNRAGKPLMRRIVGLKQGE